MPAGIEQVAWWRVSLDQNASGEVSGDHLAAGLLGERASFERSTPRSDGYVRVWGAGSLIAVTMTRSRSTTIEFRDLRVNRKLATYELDTPGVEDVIIDPQRGVAYAAVRRVGGGVDLRRMSAMEAAVETLVGLDSRCTPDDMSVDRTR